MSISNRSKHSIKRYKSDPAMQTETDTTAEEVVKPFWEPSPYVFNYYDPNAETKDSVPYKKKSFKKKYSSSNMSKYKDISDMKAPELRAEINRKEAVIKKMSGKRKARAAIWRKYYPTERGSEGSIQLYGKTWADANFTQRENRKMGNIYGAGDYRSGLRKLGKWGTRGAGALWGGLQGIPGGLPSMAGGAYEGWKQGASLSRKLGLGDYVSENQLMAPSGMNSQQQISVNQTDNSGDIFIQSTEFLTNIIATVSASGKSDFRSDAYPLNPGLSQTFPFLSQLAQNYVMYDFQGLIFQYKPTCGDSSNSTNIALGKVIMATQYDPDAPNFLNSIQMENYQYANSSKPSNGMLHGVETKPGQTHIELLYTRTGPSSKDKTQTDIGTFYIAHEGISGTVGEEVQIGELWVTYYVRLSRANLFGSMLGLNIKQDNFTFTSNMSNFMSVSTPKSDNRIETTLGRGSTPATDLTVTFPASITFGSYLCVVEWITPGPTATTFSNPAFVNISGCEFYIPQVILPQVTGPSSGIAGGFGPTPQQNIAYCYVTVNAPQTNEASFMVQLTAGLSSPEVSSGRISLTQVSYDTSLTLN